MKITKFLMPFILLLFSCGTSNKDALMGTWEVTKCEWKGPSQKTAGLTRDYYNLNIGRVVTYAQDSGIWKNADRYFKYTYNAAANTIVLKNETLKIVALNNSEMVVQEIDGRDTLTLWFIKLD